MSADNWGTCPKCKLQYDVVSVAKADKLAKAYGKVRPEEYLKLVQELKQLPEIKTSLREDYEVRTDSDGEFSVQYRCGCEVCGFGFQYKYDQQLLKDK